MSVAAESTLRQIKLGVFDYQIENIASAATERLTALRNSRTTADFQIGDKVKINDLCGTSYLRGEIGTVVAKSRIKVGIELDRPIGRFATYIDGHAYPVRINVQPSIVDHVK